MVRSDSSDSDIRDIKRYLKNLDARLNTLEKMAYAEETQSRKVYDAADIYTPRSQPSEEIFDDGKKISASNTKKMSDKPDDGDSESINTSKWFGVIGILSLVFGVVYLIKYAIDQNLIGYLGRILLGILFGIVLIAGGELFSNMEKYRRYAMTLLGGGFAIIYFVIYAAYSFINYRNALGISQTLDLIFLNIVVIFSIIASLRHDSKIILCEAFFFGYLSLVLSPITLFTVSYGFILTCGLIFINTIKKWVDISIGGLFATYYVFFTGYYSKFNDSILPLVFVFAYFAAFLVHSFFVRSEKKEDSLDLKNILLTLLNSLLFYIASYIIMSKHYPDYLGAFTVLIAFLHFGSSYAASRINNVLTKTYFLLTALYVFLAIPTQFDGAIVSVLWSIECLALLGIALNFNDLYIRWFSYVTGAITALKVLFVDSSYHSFALSNILESARPFSYISAILIFYYMAYLLKLNESLLSDEEKYVSSVYSGSATLFATVLIGLEFHGALVTVLWVLEGILLLRAELSGNDVSFRLYAYVIGALVAIKVLFVDSQYAAFSFSNIFGSERVLAYISAIIGFYYLAYLLSKVNGSEASDEINASILYSGFATLFATFLIGLEFESYWISIAWAILAILLSYAGISYLRSDLRKFGITLFGIVVFKVFLLDASKLSTGYRTISFIILGVLLLIASFIYAKYKDRLKKIV